MRKLYNLALILGLQLASMADWPMLHGDAGHSGFREGRSPDKIALKWAREFPGERLGTAMEPIVDNGRCYVATHAGNLYAINAETGVGEWKFSTSAPFLQSPAVTGGIVISANAAGSIFGVNDATGELRWNWQAPNDSFSAAPIIYEGKVFIGSRRGAFYALDAATGRLLWQTEVNAPVRQAAAAHGKLVFITGEDLRLRAFDLVSGRIAWTSEQMSGQTARDYYPVVVDRGGKTYIVVRTNPVLSMGNHISRDRALITRHAGVDDSDWRKIDAYVKSTNALGNPALWQKEQENIIRYEEARPEQRTFYVFDAATGGKSHITPVLWVSGCQAVGAMPAATRDGELFVFYRTAYGNWTHGVAPLVGLGLYDVEKNTISPVHHTRGMQPPWNTFWGTADESQNFTVLGGDVLITHQGTLSALNLKSRNLRALWGERDTYGGFRSPAWARNEWHGPGRGAVAVSDGRIYWMTGSRLLCLREGEKEEVGPKGVETPKVVKAPTSRPPGKEAARGDFDSALKEILSKTWAPLYVEPGLHGREFFFGESGDYFRALSGAYPIAKKEQQERIRKYLAQLWEQRPPYAAAGRLDLTTGERREMFVVPQELLARLGQDKLAHPFGNLYSIWLYASQCDEWSRVLEVYPELLKCYNDFRETKWKLEPRGDLYANRYLSSLLALEKIATRKEDLSTAASLREEIKITSEQLIAWWRAAAQTGTLSNFKGSAELDPFIGQGDRISFKIAPHRHKIALFKDMTPEVAAIIQEKAPEAFQSVWQTFSLLYATWPYLGEERQVHYGENFIDPPDLAIDAFRVSAFLRKGESMPPVDIPYGRADLFHLEKLALVLKN